MAASRADQITSSRSFAGVTATIRSLLQLLRVPQWIKNGFVFAPLIFAGELTNPSSLRTTIWAFLSFSLVASSVYVMNDWLDREEDRLHPSKCKRPIASRQISGPLGLTLGLIALTAGLANAFWAVNASVAGVEVLYFTINVLYSLRLKHEVLLDVFSIGAGFVLRILAGACAISVAASHWLILCTFLLALFLGFSKRRNELEVLTHDAANHRGVLNSYSKALITQLNVIICSSTVVCYALYTVSPRTVAIFGTDRLLYTVPFVLYGLFRYLYLVEVKGDGGNPASLVWEDLPLCLSIVSWLLVCGVLIYLSPATGEQL